MYTLCSPLDCGRSSFVVRKHASHFEQHKTAFEEGGRRDDAMMGKVAEGRESYEMAEGGSNA